MHCFRASTVDAGQEGRRLKLSSCLAPKHDTSKEAMSGLFQQTQEEFHTHGIDVKQTTVILPLMALPNRRPYVSVDVEIWCQHVSIVCIKEQNTPRHNEENLAVLAIN